MVTAAHHSDDAHVGQDVDAVPGSAVEGPGSAVAQQSGLDGVA